MSQLVDWLILSSLSCCLVKCFMKMTINTLHTHRMTTASNFLRSMVDGVIMTNHTIILHTPAVKTCDQLQFVMLMIQMPSNVTMSPTFHAC